jgi:DNA invertase Pin-like site-specific DNA recombinase
LEAFGCVRIFREKESGAKTERLQLRRLLSSLKPETTLVVTRLDRLARSTADLLHILQVVSSKQATFLSLASAGEHPHTKIRQLEQKGEDEGRLTYLWLLVVVFLFMLYGLYVWRVGK